VRRAVTLCSRETARLRIPKGAGEGWSRIEPGAVTGGVYFRLLSRPQGRSCKYTLFLEDLALSQAGGRGFAAELCSASAKRARPAGEPRLALQKIPWLSVDRIVVAIRTALAGTAGYLTEWRVIGLAKNEASLSCPPGLRLESSRGHHALDWRGPQRRWLSYRLRGVASAWGVCPGAKQGDRPLSTLLDSLPTSHSEAKCETHLRAPTPGKVEH